MMLIKNNVNFPGVDLSPAFKELQRYDFICTIGYDDHSESIYDYAFEVHKSHDVPGTFWITTGRIETQDRSFGLDGPSQWGDTCTWEQLREMHNAETGTITIENHTHSHPQMGTLSVEELWEEINTSQTIFKREGFNPKYISYPYGSESVLARQFVSSFFEAGRGVDVSGRNDASSHLFNIKSRNIDTTGLGSIKTGIDNARNRKQWIDFHMHAVYPGGETDVGSACRTPEELSEIIQYIKDNNGIILSFDDAINAFMKNFYWTKHNIFQGQLYP